MKVGIKLLKNYNRKAFGLPGYQHIGDAGMDVFAAISEEINIFPGMRQLVPTGISVEIPNGYEIQVRPRSGNALKYGITVLNTPGTIDSEYRGEIGVILVNLDLGSPGFMPNNNKFTVKPGDKIAQIVLKKVEKIEWVVLDDLNETVRGSDGFGSTGI